MVGLVSRFKKFQEVNERPRAQDIWRSLSDLRPVGNYLTDHGQEFFF